MSGNWRGDSLKLDSVDPSAMREAAWIAAFPFICGFKLAASLWQVVAWLVERHKAWKRAPPFGNARWATVRELRKTGNLTGSGFVVGRLNGRVVRTRSEYSCLMFGRPGAGKSLTMGATLHGAICETLVVYDPPGTLLERFQESLREKGYEVDKIDLDRPLDGVAYDVCAILDVAEPYELESRLKQLADLATADLHDNGKNSEHFADTARILVQGMLGWLHANDRPKANLYEVAAILLSSSANKRGTIFRQIAQSGADLALMAVNMWEAAEAAKGGEASGFRSSVTRALEPWITRTYRDLTIAEEGRQSFQWAHIFDSASPRAVFLTGGVLRAGEVKPFVRIFFGQAASLLASRFRNGEFTRPTRLMIDEGVVLGRCEPVLRAVEEMRKANVTVFIGYQSLSQLRDIWGRRAQTLLDCCDVIVSGGSKSPKDYLDFSQLIGSRTVKTNSKGAQGASEAEVGRHLWAIEDGFKLEGASSLTLLGNHAVVLSKPYKITKNHVDYVGG